MRLFLALPLPNPIEKQLVAFSEKLQNVSAGLSIRWVKPGNIHLTLKFLGKSDERLVASIKQEIGAAAEGFQSLACRLERPGAFPNVSKPRVIWVGLHSQDDLAQLKRLAADIDRRMSQLGFEPDSKPFSPHLTLGRVKVARGGWPEQIRRRFANLTAHIRTTQIEPSEFDFERIVLFKSILKPDGPVYQRLYEAELGREKFEG